MPDCLAHGKTNRRLRRVQREFLPACHSFERFVTGLTRNGVWLIEDGRIVRPITNLRFTQSYLEALAPGAIRGASRERSLVREWMSDEASGPSEPLTAREQEVVKLIAEAYTNKQIADALHMAEKTVESHRGNVLRKLGMRDRVELVRYAVRRGLVEP